MRPRQAVAALELLATAALTACEFSGPGPIPAPTIESVAITPGQLNVLSATAEVLASGGDSAAVEFSLVGASSSRIMTPAVPLVSGVASIPVLGLEPSREYEARVVAFGAGGSVRGDVQGFVTAALPPDLPVFVAEGTAPSPGFVAFGAGNYGLVIDNGGRVVWYHHFPSGVGLNFQPEPNGRYVALPPPATTWLEIAPSGEVTRTLGCGHGLKPRLHDVMARRDGSYWLLCDETRTLDLTSLGGMPDARVTGTAVQHLSAAGDVLFEWSPFSHLDPADADPALLSGPTVNWTHGNALDLDADGNLVVSFRNLNEVTGIDTRTGSVLWRLGGRRNEFTLAGSSDEFSGQHSARALPGNQLLLLDNLGASTESRAELWTIDRVSKVARQVKSMGAVPPALTAIGGSVQPLANGHTLVSFGVAGRVEEYDSSGSVVWRIRTGAGYVFRATRIQSLYDPGIGLTR